AADDFTIVDDVDTTTIPVADPPDFWRRVRAAGYRSLLIVRVRTHHQMLAVHFWSKRPRAFEPRHVPVARRIADHLAVRGSHDELSQMASEAAQARLRADRLEVRVKSFSDELAARRGHGRVVGPSLEWQAVLRAATQVAATDTTVLLAGES